MELIDSHCHLNYDYSPKSTENLVDEAAALNVKTLITIGTDIKTLQDVQNISDRFENVFHTVGVHPHDAKDLTKDGIDTLRKASTHKKCRAIGEIGLDYHYDHSPRDTQVKALKKQLELALEVSLPVVIHSRDAEADLLAALETYCQSAPKGLIPGVIHCFTGTHDFGRACIDLGFFISFSGILTFKKSTELQETAKAFPLENLMVETDSPYLAPVPYRGKKCEPSMVVKTAEKLAELKGVSIEEVAKVTTRNSKALFQIST